MLGLMPAAIYAQSSGQSSAQLRAQSGPLVSGGSPPCSRKVGRRFFRSATAWDGDTAAFISGISANRKSGCQSIAQLHLERGTKPKAFKLPDAARQDFAIVDFSPDAAQILMSAKTHEKSPNEQFRYLQVGTVAVAGSDIEWRNIWDILGWKDCDATVDPLGFTAEGNVALRARPSVMATPRRRNCLQTPQLYAIDRVSGAVSTINKNTDIKRYGKVVSSARQSCKADPDLVGKCFSIKGKISAWNGNPTFRIAPANTKRILGVAASLFPPSQPQMLPEPLWGKVNMDTDASGDLYVCPLSAEEPGHMQMVCVESASNVAFHRR